MWVQEGKRLRRSPCSFSGSYLRCALSLPPPFPFGPQAEEERVEEKRQRDEEERQLLEEEAKGEAHWAVVQEKLHEHEQKKEVCAPLPPPVPRRIKKMCPSVRCHEKN